MSKQRKAARNASSDIDKSIEGLAKALHKIGAIDEETLEKFKAGNDSAVVKCEIITPAWAMLTHPQGGRASGRG